jgi:hypothetical protein
MHSFPLFITNGNILYRGVTTDGQATPRPGRPAPGAAARPAAQKQIKMPSPHRAAAGPGRRGAGRGAERAAGRAGGVRGGPGCTLYSGPKGKGRGQYRFCVCML